MKISRIFKRCCLIMLATLLAGSLAHAQEETKPRLAILPFSLNAPDDSDYLKEGVRTMLASRIAARAGVLVIGGVEGADLVGERDERDPEALAGKLTADLVLTGSITVLGPSVSIDARLYMVGKDISESFFAAAENQALLIGAVDLMATEVSSVISGEDRRPSREEEPQAGLPPASSESAPAPEDQSLHPDRIFKKPVVVPPPEAPAEVPAAAPPVPTAPVLGPESGQASSPDPDLSATRSQFLDLEIQVIDAGDIFGRGAETVVIADKQEIGVFSLEQGQLRKVTELPEAPGYVWIIALNLADLNGNGRAEIYISAVADNTPYSYAVEWDGKGFKKLFDEQRHYLRPIDFPGKGLGLYGQWADFEGPVRPGIFKADPQTGALDENHRLDLPDSVNLYEFVPGDFTGNGRTEIAVQTVEQALLLYDHNGDVLWRGSGKYGYTKRFAGKPYTGEGTAETVQIPARLVAADLNGDGRMELAAMENPTGLESMLKTIDSYVGGEIKILTWDGVSFTEFWSTGEIGSYMAGFQLGKERLFIGMAAKKSGGLFKGLHSFVATYALP
ncbi:MAG: hypothetical protein ABR605_07330 [Desulfurivibrionaceae bacterium]